MPQATRIRCLLIPRFNMLTLTGLLEPARIANHLSQGPLYSTTFHSFDGETVIASNGSELRCEPAPEKLDRDDLVMLFGSWGSEHYQNPRTISWLRLQARLGARICGVEIGAYVLARSGLLTRKQATTHWSYLSGFQEQFPDVSAVEQLFTENGKILTCSGGTAGIDLMLHLIGQKHGSRLAAEISDQIMHHPVRTAEAPQRVTSGRGAGMLPMALRAALDLIEQNISEPLSVPELSRRIGLSQRQLERLFVKEMGCSVVQLGLLTRLQHARVLLISTSLGVREIAAASGFNSLSHFAYAFRKCFGKKPSEYRQAWPGKEAEPHSSASLSRLRDAKDARRLAGRQA